MVKKVTVLTLVYNGLPYLKEAIESTLEQTFKDFDYLIIDDASPDQNIQEFVDTYNDPRINFLRNENNLGVSETFNKALELISTEYVVRLDQDDINLPNRIEEQINYLEVNKDISIVCSWEHTIDSSGKIVRDWKKSIKNYGEFLGPVLLGLCPIWHPSIAFRKDDMIKVGGFKREYTRAEDFEVTSRLARNRLSAAIVPKFHLLQRHHEASQSSEFINEQARITHVIQSEAISDFMSPKNAEDLAFFLRFEIKPEINEKHKSYILRMKKYLNQLLSKITEVHELNNSESFSLKKVIYRRLGLGVLLVDYFRFLPQFLFIPLFFILSPLFSKNLHNKLSYFYNFIHELKYSITKPFK